ncbi:MAG: hypothetical protein NTV80_04785 [Verrucomicrobia bacterium]|nr:hypothetical protein [Verrucomicrobiota bacterium]
MNTNDPRFEIIRRCRDGQASTDELAQLEVSLRKDADFREAYVRYMNLDVALSAVAKATPMPAATIAMPKARTPRWYAWRPLTAAAAGLVFGMFCTSVVFGFVAQRVGVKQTPLVIYDAGLENEKQALEDGLPKGVGHWGMDAARVVSAEDDVKPMQGLHMLRLEPIPKDEQLNNRPSRVYQLLDLRSLPVHDVNGDAEVQVTASFCAEKSVLKSRYVMRVFALDEAPEQATKNFWPKAESNGAVSETQRFDVEPGDAGWHTFSLKLHLPPDSKSLMIILGVAPRNDIPLPPSVHYLDAVQVSLITPQTPLP